MREDAEGYLQTQLDYFGEGGQPATFDDLSLTYQSVSAVLAALASDGSETELVERAAANMVANIEANDLAERVEGESLYYDELSAMLLTALAARYVGDDAEQTILDAARRQAESVDGGDFAAAAVLLGENPKLEEMNSTVFEDLNLKGLVVAASAPRADDPAAAYELADTLLYRRNASDKLVSALRSQ